MKYCKVLLFALLVSCHTTQSENENRIETISFLPDSMYVIIDYDGQSMFKNANATTLSTAELEELEELLNKASSAHNSNQLNLVNKHNLDNPENQITVTGQEVSTENHKRQYLPIINNRGEKEVWINFNCGTWFSKDKTEIFQVHDGGNCHYNLIINLTKKSFSNLSVNGHA